MSKNRLSHSLTPNDGAPIAVGPDDHDRPSLPAHFKEPKLRTEPKPRAESALLAASEPYIRALVHKTLPHNIVPPDILDLEIDELEQNVRIKLWKAESQKRAITNLQAYIRTIVYHEVVDMVRKNHHHLPLPTDEDGELFEGKVLLSASEGMTDPAQEVEQTEMTKQLLVKVVKAICTLPHQQQYAMICSLKEGIDTTFPLVEVFAKQGVDIGAISWPNEQKGSQLLRTTLSLARKKLRQLLKTEHISQVTMSGANV